jgi:penicillin amidase
MTAKLTPGSRGELVYSEQTEELGEITVAVLDPWADLDVVDDWVRRRGSEFWGLGGHTREELGELYAFVDSLPTHHAYLVRRNGEPVVLLQTYDPEHDPVGEHYPVEPGDVGVHFFLGGRGAPVPGFTLRILDALCRFVFERPDAARLVAEPDVRNERAVALMARFGFELGDVVELDHKVAQLAYLPRPKG